ncbi:MAG: sulfur carrier protein ThiS [Acidipila sp.]|nr:sulfur carrier protein ThiS [Acidipila sp.]
MKILLNGEHREVPEGLTVTGLLAHLAIPAGRIAIERNLDILQRDKWASTTVAAGDRFEVVHFVGGG